jgi:Ca2+:H+ antiporter
MHAAAPSNDRPQFEAHSVLVLGMCFFAGGLRFSEQGFDQSETMHVALVPRQLMRALAATQIHSSLLNISVGALLLPAAYHFAISGGKDSGSHEQKRDILRMSHGVRVALLSLKP